VDSWKDGIFMYESRQVPEELQIVSLIARAFKDEPEHSTTLVQVTHSLDEAAGFVDNFKAQTFGSASSLAVVNLNFFGTMQEFNFLMQPDILGDPRMIFVASLKSMTGEQYTFAKSQVQRERETSLGGPSCIDCYSANNREEAAARLGKLMAAYLREGEERMRLKRSGTFVLHSEVLEQLRASTTTFYGNRGRGTMVIRASALPKL